jgi:hypothetical protein
VNKKLLGLTLILIFVAMLVAPVMAKKGQTKQDFKLLFQALPPSSPYEKEAAGNIIHRDANVTIDSDSEFYVKIGPDGATEDITKEYLGYECDMDWVTHANGTQEQFFTVHVVETISIYSSDVTHDETTLRGTLVLTSIGDNKGGHGGNFAGHGMGEFEGVKIQGASEPLQLVFVPGPHVQLTRIGTVMGWP